MKNIRLRLYYSYRHSFRSGGGWKDFVRLWKQSKEVFEPKVKDTNWEEELKATQPQLD